MSLMCHGCFGYAAHQSLVNRYMIKVYIALYHYINYIFDTSDNYEEPLSNWKYKRERRNYQISTSMNQYLGRMHTTYFLELVLVQTMCFFFWSWLSLEWWWDHKISTCHNMSILAACRISRWFQCFQVVIGDIKQEVNDKLHHCREAMVYESKPGDFLLNFCWFCCCRSFTVSYAVSRHFLKVESWETKTWSWSKWISRPEAHFFNSYSPKHWGEWFFGDQNRQYSKMVSWRVLSHLCHFMLSMLVFFFGFGGGTCVFMVGSLDSEMIFGIENYNSFPVRISS